MRNVDVEIVRSLFESPTVRVSRFRCPIDHPDFANTGPSRGYLFVFPREAVEIHQFGREAVVANCNTVMLYNRGQEYRRRRISPRGDRCEFFNIRRDVLLDSLARYDPTVNERPDHPFDSSHGWSSDRLYMRQRQIVCRLREAPGTLAPLEIEEELVALVDAAVDDIYRGRGLRSLRPLTNQARPHRMLVDAARELISQDFGRPLTLSGLASQLETSEGHLCRVFRRETGMTLHGYWTRLRLRTALDWIQGAPFDLTRVAIDLGFSSHSHFTAAFRRQFGLTPSQWRDNSTRPRAESFRADPALDQ